jgi:hypothetical protein
LMSPSSAISVMRVALAVSAVLRLTTSGVMRDI